MADLQQIKALIAVHKATWVALDAACDITDAAMGTSEESAAEEAQSTASDATAVAIWAIIEHPYTTLDELKLGMSYLAEHHRSTGDGDPAEWFTGFARHLTGMSMEAQS